MNTNNRPRHYNKRKAKIVEQYIVRMNDYEKNKIRKLAKSLKMTPSKLIRLSIMDTIQTCLIF